MKNIQKLLWLLVFSLSASLYAADWTGSTSEPKSSKEIDGKTFYMITSAEELAWFAAQVNAGKTTINAQLANDIKFMDDTSKISTISWTPIGKDSTVMFSGIFDGAGWTIYCLYSRQGKFAGLFGVTGKTAEVKNLTLKLGDIEAINGPAYAGGIVAYNSGLVSKCANHSSVSFSSNFKGGVSGGIVGENAGTVKGCINSGSVSASAFYSAYSGGIVGWNSGTVMGCVNSGLVSASSMSSHLQGDIVGVNRGTVIDASDIYFSIRFFDSDTTLLDSQYVQYGKTPGYAGTPTKASTAQYTYAFEGWHVEPTAATEDFDYYAVYSETLRSYTVRFLDFDGSELQSGEIAYGTLPSYNGTTPTKASSAKYTYTFTGWEPAIDTVKGPATYTAVFDSTQIPQGRSSSSNAVSSSSGKSSSSAKSSSSSAVKNSSSSSENPDALIANLPVPTWSVTASGRNFQIHAAPVGKPYALFDLQGKVLAKGRVEGPEMTISAPRAGSYIVRVGNHSVRVNAR